MSGNYGKLDNSGTLQVKNLILHSDSFPKPFIIHSGLFHFEQDKMVFNQFKAQYGQSDFTLNGSLSNVINYALQQDAVLKGNFDLQSNHLVVDEFMAFADTSSKTTTKASSSSSSGVVLIPSNLSITFNANVNDVAYNGLKLTQLKGQLIVDSGKLQMKQSGFTIVGAPVVMDASYQSVSPKKAVFDYHINAKNFDIYRAYNEIKLFHDMATSAAYVRGVVSLDYQLSGRLDADMHPVYPSLKGSGVLTLNDVKIKGLKLLSAVSKATSKDSLNNPNLKGIAINSKIENNIITIARTKMKIFGFRPRFEGQVSFDGKLNLSGRIGLPPLGIFGIPFTVSGTQDNPVVRLKRNKNGKLEETEDKDEE
jgi:AsmA protein